MFRFIIVEGPQFFAVVDTENKDYREDETLSPGANYVVGYWHGYDSSNNYKPTMQQKLQAIKIKGEYNLKYGRNPDRLVIAVDGSKENVSIAELNALHSDIRAPHLTPLELKRVFDADKSYDSCSMIQEAPADQFWSY